MKTLENAQDKIKKICNLIREDTLKPAKEESIQIIQQAQDRAEQIIIEAQNRAAKLQADATALIQQERSAFESSLQLASKQALEVLRQSIENRFFKQNLGGLVEKSSADIGLIVKLIETMIGALEKQGLAADLTVIIPKTVNSSQINELLLKTGIKQLQEHDIVVGDFAGGVRVKLNNKNMTLDMSNEAITSLITTHIARKDFRKLLFES